MFPISKLEYCYSDQTEISTEIIFLGKFSKIVLSRSKIEEVQGTGNKR